MAHRTAAHVMTFSQWTEYCLENTYYECPVCHEMVPYLENSGIVVAMCPKDGNTTIAEWDESEDTRPY